MKGSRRGAGPVMDVVAHHRGWLSLVDVTGPFLSLPVLRATWPAGLDGLDKPVRDRLRREHGVWQDDEHAGQKAWVEYVLRELLGWGADLHDVDPNLFAVPVGEYDTILNPSFALIEPDGDPNPEDARLLVTVCPADQHPTARMRGEVWPESPADRMARMCRGLGVQLGLVTNGRWWALVWARPGNVSGFAVFDAAAWGEAAERDVVRAFVSLLGRTRFFGVPEEQRLPVLLRDSQDNQEEITEQLGIQVRQAVELLVAAIGRADVAARKRNERDLEDISAHDVYRGAVSIMMRIVFLLFAEERGLLPSDNELYARAYSAGRLGEELEAQAREGTEDELENRSDAWHRLLALFHAVHDGVDHDRLRMPAHDGGLFDPDRYLWLPMGIDDRTVLHMLRAVQWVRIGRGRNVEARKLSFRTLDVEQIGYVYEGLLSFDGLRAAEVVVGLTGKQGLEDEIPLSELEELAANCTDTTELGAAIAERYKKSGIGSARAVTSKLAPLAGGSREEARKKLLAVTDGDYALAERLLPFHGLLRTDLRELPVVILPGALYVTESPLRGNTGTHYTPRALAEEVVLHALQPLVYSPGPLQTADRGQWKLVASRRILKLKVADIAVGSAAFLVAAARYLADRLIEAWIEEDDPRVAEHRSTTEERSVGAEEDPVVVEARREVIEHCLYGVDINPMAVEMAKLSLWLVSMDATRPFTFLDDRLVAGDSLLGITSLEQLEYLHLDPKKARELQAGTLDWTVDIREAVAGIAETRRKIADVQVGDDPLAALDEKHALLEEANMAARQFRLLADLTVGAALAGSQKWSGSRDRRVREEMRDQKESSRDGLFLEATTLAGQVLDGAGSPAAIRKSQDWLRTDQIDGAPPREPLHWPLAFPEVFEDSGFDAIIGNPPFLGGQKLTGSLGTAYREHLVESIGAGARGSADLVAYFVLRAHQILQDSGQTGLIATNTLAQGDTREVGLDQLTAGGVAIRRSIKSKPWPSKSAVLEYCAIWTSRSPLAHDVIRTADDVPVSAINSSLEPCPRVVGSPNRLIANAASSFQGAILLGAGFIVDGWEAKVWISENASYSDVLIPYLGGQDLNSSIDFTSEKFAIDFQDWPEDEARKYDRCFARVERTVKEERLAQRDLGAKRYWWRFLRPRVEMRRAISNLDYVLAMTIHTSTVIPVRVPSRRTFSHGILIFASDSFGKLAILSSAPHYWWAKRYGSSLKSDLRYTASDIYETFPSLTPGAELSTLGDRLDSFRREVMLARQTGLTKTYNLVFDKSVTDSDIVELREIHRAIDEATVRAYGWHDLLDQLDHGFHPAGRDIRYTIGPNAQREILDRLLELNHARYAEEVAQGLHNKAAKKTRKAKPVAMEEGLF